MAQRSTILCIDDEAIILVSLQQQLARALPEHTIETAEDAEEALEVLEQLHAGSVSVPLVICDQIMPGLKGDELLAKVHARWPDIRTVMLTGQADAEAVGRAVNSARLYRYLGKPWRMDDLTLTVRSAVEAFEADKNQARLLTSLEAEVAQRQRVSNELLRQANARSAGPLLGDSPRVRRLRSEVSEHARHNRPVLVQGPPGAGLEAAARAIHAESSRAQGPFLIVACAMVAHADEIGSVVDSAAGQMGVALGGTLYLHGIERLLAAGQRRVTELLRTEGAGSRLIAGAVGTNATALLPGELSTQFHSQISIPPLRDRMEDLFTLTSFFLSDALQRNSRAAERISDDSWVRLQNYPWPGNITELRHVIERAVARSTGPLIDVDEALVEQGTALGSYRLTERIGEGGMGEVWRATHGLLTRPAAIKLVKKDVATADAIERFRREARAIARLRSPHTVELYDFGIADDGQLFFVMEMLEGLDLQRLVEHHGPLPEARAIYLLRQACRSLGEAHAAGLVHRDIKPANLFVGRLGLDADFLKVLDFGIVTPDDHSSKELTGEAGTVGTIAYLSPEAAFGDPVDGRADIYGLGCTMFWMVTGQLVFPGKTAMAMAMAHAQQPPPTLAEVGISGVSQEYEALMRTCLAKARENRPASALELEAELDRLEQASMWSVTRARAWWSESDGKGLRQ